MKNNIIAVGEKACYFRGTMIAQGVSRFNINSHNFSEV